MDAATGLLGDGCRFSVVSSDEQQRFLCQPLSAGYFPFSASLWERGGEARGGRWVVVCCPQYVVMEDWVLQKERPPGQTGTVIDLFGIRRLHSSEC